LKGSLHAQHAQHALSPSIYWQTCASSSHVEFSALAQCCAGRQRTAPIVHAKPQTLSVLRSAGNVRPSCSERDQHGHALVWGGMRCHLLVCAPCQCRCQQASHRPNYKGTASCKHGHLTVLQAVCVRRACSDRLGTHWCSAGCDAIFLPVLHGSTAPAGTTSKFGHPFIFSFAGLPHHSIMKMLVLHTCAHGFHNFSKPV